MSNDIMPCGCEGHADDQELCRYPALVDCITTNGCTYVEKATDGTGPHVINTKSDKAEKEVKRLTQIIKDLVNYGSTQPCQYPREHHYDNPSEHKECLVRFSLYQKAYEEGNKL